MLRQETGELQLGYLQELGSFSGGDSSLTKQLQSYQLPLAASQLRLWTVQRPQQIAWQFQGYCQRADCVLCLQRLGKTSIFQIVTDGPCPFSVPIIRLTHLWRQSGQEGGGGALESGVPLVTGR